jgi:4-amino-4-deoxy-L-arabinose transferase-like glycosyltransferase
MVLVFCLIVCAGASWAIVLEKLLTDGLLLIAWLFAAGGYGSVDRALRAVGGRHERVPAPAAAPSAHQAPRPCGQAQRDEPLETCIAPLRFVTRLAVGIGILSLLQLGMGLCGWLGRGPALAVCAVGWLIAAARMVRWRPDPARLRAWMLAPATIDWLWLITLPLLAIAIVAALVPPGVLWGDEPHGYDVLEYHLQLPREWLQIGHIAPLHHNVFSYFPLATEMHYLLAMQLRGGPWAGMYLAQLMHLAICALTVIAVYAAGRSLGTRAGAIVGAVAVATVPWIALLAPVAYNEGGLLLFGTLCVAWCVHAMRSVNPWRAWALAGALAGFACGVKLTGAPMLLLAVPLIAMIIAVFLHADVRRRAMGCIVFGVVGTAVFSPWLIRNITWTGNPFFPEAQATFGRAHFSQVQSERWQRAHSPTPTQRALGGRLAAGADQILADWRFGFLLLPLGLFAIAASWRRAETWLAAGVLIFCAVFWLLLTHLQGRFFVLAIPLAGLLIAQVRQRGAARILAALTIVQCALALGFVGPKFMERAGPFRDNQLLGAQNIKSFLPPEIEQAIDQPDTAIALAGDARAFLYQLPSARLIYRTVFDVDAQRGETIVNAWLAGRAGAATIVVDPVELDRFSRTYYGIAPLPANFPGPRDRAFILQRRP